MFYNTAILLGDLHISIIGNKGSSSILYCTIMSHDKDHENDQYIITEHKLICLKNDKLVFEPIIIDKNKFSISITGPINEERFFAVIFIDTPVPTYEECKK